MKRNILIVSGIFLLLNTAFAQELLPFKLTGRIDGVDTGRVQLIMVGLNDSARNVIVPDRTVLIKEGKFELTGKIAYPHAVYINVFDDKKMYPSELFFLESGTQDFRCNIDSVQDNVPIIPTSHTNNEFLNGYWKSYNSNIVPLYDMYSSHVRLAPEKYGTKIPEVEQERILGLRNGYIGKRDTLIYRYAQANPSSYVSLWLITERFNVVGYKEVYEKSFLALSKEIIATKTGKFLWSQMEVSKKATVGRQFPNFIVESLSGERRKLYDLGNGTRYTLIDFWFSHCGPCISEFPELKKIHATYVNKGFTMLGVSVDPRSDKGDLDKAIIKHGLIWEQVWDVRGSESSRLAITSFPSNFLLDEKGYIIQKNIKPLELKKFLERKLSSGR